MRRMIFTATTLTPQTDICLGFYSCAFLVSVYYIFIGGLTPFVRKLHTQDIILNGILHYHRCHIIFSLIFILGGYILTDSISMDSETFESIEPSYIGYCMYLIFNRTFMLTYGILSTLYFYGAYSYISGNLTIKALFSGVVPYIKKLI